MHGFFLRSKERKPIVNWAVKDGILGEAHKLTVANTLGDKNCLFHSAMLGLVGLLDRDDPTNNVSRGLLRRMVGRFLTAHKAEVSKRVGRANSSVDAEAWVNEATKEAERHGEPTDSLSLHLRWPTPFGDRFLCTPCIRLFTARNGPRIPLGHRLQVCRRRPGG